MEAQRRSNINTVDQLASNLGGINLNRERPPHRPQSRHNPRPSYAPAPPPMPSRVSSPSEGAYARDPNRRLVYREPKPRENLCFSGKSKMLRQFLLDIYDGLYQNVFDFASDKRRIIWIASHFLTDGTEVNPAQSWFSSLLMQNAFEHGVVDQYANLKSLEFVIRPLLSADAFIDEMIVVFGDKTSAKTAREALDKCKQGNTSIIDYNARVKALAFGVQQHEDDALLKYVSGLHLDIQEECINIQGWIQAKTLQEKMNLAITGADRALERAALPQRSQRHKLYQHPNKTVSTTIPVQFTAPKPVAIPVPMEIDAISARNSDKKNPFSVIRSICIKKGLCFRCIKPFDVETHMVNGERKCPNQNATLAEKLALLTPVTDKKAELKTHQIAAVNFEDAVETQDVQALNELGEEEREVVDWLLEDYLAGLSTPSYPPPSELKEQVDVCSIRLAADPSVPRRINVPMTLREHDLSIPVVAFLDTGSEGDFLNEKFAMVHKMKIKKKEIPLQCVGYDGRRGADVLYEWEGKIRAVGERGEWEEHDLVLNVTRLGTHDMIIGLPWMQRVGCSLMLNKGKSYLMIGQELIEALPSIDDKSTTLNCESKLSCFDIHLPQSLLAFSPKSTQTTNHHPMKHHLPSSIPQFHYQKMIYPILQLRMQSTVINLVFLYRKPFHHRSSLLLSKRYA